MSKKNKFAAELFPKVLFVSILGLAAIAVRAGESCANVDICVCDIYGGELMKSVKRGEIKKLRVVENLEASGNSRGFWEGARKQSPGVGYYDGILLAPLGPANVGRDGSARFCAPAGKKLFLQALDANGDMVFTSRAFDTPKQGGFMEFADLSAEPVRISAKAETVAPEIEKYPDGIFGKPVSFQKTIRPILDNHCVDCHDFECGGAAKMILSPDRGLAFSKSYTEIIWKEGVAANVDGMKKIHPANFWGAKQSRIVWILRNGHGGCELSDGEFFALRLWIDLNAPYYDTPLSAYGKNPGGRSPLTSAEIKKLFEICKVRRPESEGENGLSARGYPIEIISFDRPESSEILLNVSRGSDAYLEALDIIKKGAKRLAEKPREDM